MEVLYVIYKKTIVCQKLTF